VEQKRLFWAVSLPEHIKRKLFGLQSKLREISADVKWVEQHNFHLTLKFLGDTNASQVQEIIDAVYCSIKGTGPFSLQLSGIGFFPAPKRPKVIWIGVVGELNKFKQLHEKVEEAAARLGFTDHSNRFSPHLTLGRIRSSRGSVELADRTSLLAKDFGIIGEFKVNSIELIESQLTRKGPFYTTLVSLEL